MKAAEIIAVLERVSPDSEVRVATSEGVYDIEEVRSTGYAGVVNIVTE